MDGRHCGHANRDQAKEVFGVSLGRYYKPSGRSGTTEENVFCSMPISFRSMYGCVGQVIADRGELDSDKTRKFLAKHGVWLTLTTTYNSEANGKIERGHSPIVKALAKRRYAMKG